MCIYMHVSIYLCIGSEGVKDEYELDREEIGDDVIKFLENL